MRPHHSLRSHGEGSFSNFPMRISNHVTHFVSIFSRVAGSHRTLFSIHLSETSAFGQITLTATSGTVCFGAESAHVLNRNYCYRAFARQLPKKCRILPLDVSLFAEAYDRV